jgi:hypothetical protein
MLKPLGLSTVTAHFRIAPSAMRNRLPPIPGIATSSGDVAPLRSECAQLNLPIIDQTAMNLLVTDRAEATDDAGSDVIGTGRKLARCRGALGLRTSTRSR